jgi:hypothetical protein
MLINVNGRKNAQKAQKKSNASNAVVLVLVLFAPFVPLCCNRFSRSQFSAECKPPVPMRTDRRKVSGGTIQYANMILESLEKTCGEESGHFNVFHAGIFF